MRFDELEIIDPILRSLKEQGYTEPTSIQEQAIPLLLDGHDIIASAQTGTGKTAAFAIPIIQHLHLDKERNPRAKKIKTLVLTPTRELAIQIGESFSTYGKYTDINNTVIFGGVKQHAQTSAIRNGVDVLVATPGRLLDLMDQGYIKLKDIEYFVLDEADRMLDMGFIHDIRRVLAVLPDKRQSLFFSATMPMSILDLSRRILNNPKKVAVSPVSSTADTIQQLVYYTNKQDKGLLLLHILEDPSISQVLIFSRTKHGADKIVKFLNKHKISASAIHGNKAQNARQKALKAFKDREIRALVATDIAARGIDIDKLQHVVNYDIPNESETYVHRIGRSGRAGEEGMAISICEPEENTYMRDVEKLINLRIPKAKDNPYPQTDLPMSDKQRKEVTKEKNRAKQEFFANRKKKEGSGGGRGSRPSGGRGRNSGGGSKSGGGSPKPGGGRRSGKR